MKINSFKTIISALPLFLILNTASFAKENNQLWDTLINQYHQTKLQQFDAQDNLSAFADYLALHPENALAQLYTASSYCFVGRDAWMPWNKMSAVNICIDKMEVAFLNAQQQYPANSAERLRSYLTFGLTGVALPDLFQQKEASLDSLGKAKNHPSFSRLSGPLQQQVLNTLETDSQ